MNGTETTAGRLAGTAPAPARPPTAFRLLLRVNLLQGWRKVMALRQQSKLLSGLIGVFLFGYAALAFTLFYKGLVFAGQFPGLGEVLIERMLYLLFACLFALLLLSNLVISYTNLFRNREAAFLLTLPIPTETVFRWKFVESMALASWAFLFLIAPLLAAYGLTKGAPWHFYPVTVLFIALFILLPAAAGAWSGMMVARFLDRQAFQVSALLVAGGLLIAAAFWLRPDRVTDDELETRVLVVLDRLLLKTKFAQFPLLPSYWLSSGVQSWAEGALAGALFFVLVLLSNALFFGTMMFTRMGSLFYAAASSVQSRGSVLGRWGWFRALQRRRRSVAYQRGPLERFAAWMPGLGGDVRAVLVKDIRVFWRDTTQWGQTLVLFGLLAVYIMNLRHFSAQFSGPFWINVVSYLNLAACSLNLATLTTRFVFPQFSLEGKRVWIVGLAPLGLARVLLTKFALASVVSLIITLTLLVLSCRMLSLEWARIAYLAGAVTVMSFALNGLAIGLGALYPNLKEDNPSKIVSGFGGTFCLVVSFAYVVSCVVLVAAGYPWPDQGSASWLLTAGSGLGFLLLSGLVGGLPLRLGLRRVAHLEI
ncbi:MAG: putative ABC transporter permease subunit [Limisphaerales bacterium]